ncbi:MAG: aspartate--tRNA ligase [Oscillospiraceae bacterium]|nr:aspartate--tRNA ligase [Oscillospiraceae bacterium]
METLQGIKRTHKCTELSESNIGQTVTVMGWTQVYRQMGALTFIDLRDISGMVQLSFSEDINKEAFEKAQTVRNEYVLAAVGTVVKRSSINPNMKTGTIEIQVTELRILNASETPPFAVEENSKVREEIRLKYRYIDLRRPDLRKNLITRHKAAQLARNYFSDNDFLEIETPMLTKSTPEGARDYLVPSRVHPGSFYALPQSPQLYKQILMLSGADRYFQIVKCFRDEDLRADRQPEFTQIDLEMSFVDTDDVISVNEKFIQKLFKEIADVDVRLPLRRIPYKEAMERYGSDKPDTRFGLELNDISDIAAECDFKVFRGAVESGGSVRGINIKGGAKFSRKEIDSLGEFVKTYRAKGLAWLSIGESENKSSFAKFMKPEETEKIISSMKGEKGDLLVFVADKNRVVFDSLGALRIEAAKRLDLIKDNTYEMLWVTEFPLLEYSEEEGRYTAMHHPFTAPMEEDIEYLETDPGRVRAKAYDIIINGYEAGGGSIRIYDSGLQEKMFNVLGFTKEDAWERFGFLLEGFRYGTPPHGGMAYGFDRLIMILTGCDNIRDVIAFPKVQNASELMTDAPSAVDEKQLEELSIGIADMSKD